MPKPNNHAPLLIRHAVNKDLPNITKLHTVSWRDVYQGHMPQDFLDNKITDILANHWRKIKISDQDVILVAQNKKIIGFIAVWCKDAVLIDNLHVLPEHRAQKTGQKLMKAATEKLIAKGHSEAYLWALEGNKKAIKFYEKLGAQKVEVKTRDLYGISVRSVKMQWKDIKVILDAS